MNSPVAVDFETFYDSHYSLKKMTTWRYCFDSRFDAYLVAIHSHDIQFVGHPKNFDWNSLRGRELVMHNAGFDSTVMLRLEQDGVIPKGLTKSLLIHDTADLAAYLGCRRNLQDSMKFLLGKTISKTVRAQMQGKTLEQAQATGMEDELLAYARSDAVNELELWTEKGHLWPENERLVSRSTREEGQKGVRIDVAAVTAGLGSLRAQLHEAEKAIPWDWSSNDTPLSLTKMRSQCRSDGIPVPTSFAMNDEACAEWFDEFAPKFPWIEAVRRWRRMNMLVTKLETLQEGVRSDGHFPFSLKYFGATTGRWSGDGKFNMQNLPREPIFGVDLRKMILPDEGHVFVVADLAQIEARLLIWAVGDRDLLDLIRQGHSVYEAHAIRTMGWTGGNLKKEDPRKYLYAKTRVLGLGYGCGSKKFRALAKTYGLDLTEDEASMTVADFRATNPRIPMFWSNIQRWAAYSAANKELVHRVVLPSGRRLPYFAPTISNGRELTASFIMGDEPRKIYGGLLTENFIQAAARDVVVHDMVKLISAGLPARWTIHDEFVCSVHRADAMDAVETVRSILRTPPEWAKDCPLDCEIAVVDAYTK